MKSRRQALNKGRVADTFVAVFVQGVLEVHVEAIQVPGPSLGHLQHSSQFSFNNLETRE